MKTLYRDADGVSSVNEDLQSVSAPGVIPAGLHSYSITNVGGASGTANSVPLPVGATVTYEAYYDPVKNVYNRLSGMSYDATGTTYLITIVE